MKSILAIAFLVAACGGGKSAVKTGDTTVAAKGDGVLAITELKFFEADKMGVHLHPDGKLEFLAMNNGTEAWQDIGVVAADGTITAKDGKHAQLMPDGTFKGPDGEVPGFKLDADVLVIGDKHITLDDKGTLLMEGKAADKTMRVEGATDARSKRTALLIMALMLTATNHEAEAPAKTGGY